jgi:nitrite reductase/ring-hydroxylating ferredoxin subunit/uncharacterized membrane protein
MAALFFDLLGRVGRTARWRAGADAGVAVGLVGALAAAPAGLVDWSHTSGMARRMGLVHATANVLAALLYAGSLVSRMTGRRDAGVRLGVLGYLCLLGGAYLGGKLVYNLGVGVSRTAWSGGPTTFQRAMREADLAEGRPAVVTTDGEDVLLLRQGAAIYALSNICTHQGGPLVEGDVRDGMVTCPWLWFRLRSGGRRGGARPSHGAATTLRRAPARGLDRGLPSVDGGCPVTRSCADHRRAASCMGRPG